MRMRYGLFCAALAACFAVPVGAAEVEAGDCYCFSSQDFAQALKGICITRLPEAALGRVMLGQRQLRTGDVLTAEQASRMTFAASENIEDGWAAISYLPVSEAGVSPEATMTLSLRSRENKPPVAEDCAFETYKNLELTGKLRVSEPEGETMTFTLTREPRRGSITIGEDGSFTYTPKKNKVGIDSFTYTAADAGGKTSREATVTISILKPSDACQYRDTLGNDCRFAAEWMKNTGIFVGESVAGDPCFAPERPVSRGEFLAMLVKTLKLPTDAEVIPTGYEDAPKWLQPYLAAALRSGLLTKLPAKDTFAPITAQEAAALLEALGQQETAAELNLQPEQELTRGETAVLLYQTARNLDGYPM